MEDLTTEESSISTDLNPKIDEVVSESLFPNYKKMSDQNSIFILQDSTLVKEETVLCPDYHSIKMEGITTYQNEDHIEDIKPESSNINEINVHANKKEIPDSNTGIQNTTLNLEDDLVKEEMYIKQEILSDDDNNKIYHTENVWVDNNRSDNITINTFNVYKEIKTEDDCTDYSIQNSKFYIEDGYSVKNENVSSINDENTTSKNNYDNNLSYNYENLFTKVEQISTEYCDILNEKIIEIKPENDYETDILETSTNVNHKDVNNDNTIQLKITPESSNINEINVHGNKKEIPDSNTGIQNTTLNLEDDLVKEEMYIKQEILSDDDNNKIYHTENVWVDNNRSDNITINTFNVYKEIKTEDDCTDYSIQNSKFYIEDGYSVKNENVSSINDENTTSKNNYDNNLSYNYENLFTKVEQISTEYCDIFNENIVEIKPEIDYETDILETSTNVNHKDVNNDNTIQLKSISNSDKKQYQCDICKQSFVKKEVLKNHINAHHTGGNPKQCDLGQKKCTQQRSLKRHNFTHSAEKPYKCGICQKSYTRTHSLNIHMLTHTGEKPFKCGICQKSYTRTNSLNIHMLTHTGDKPYKCEICDKSFTQKNNLNIHMFTHTGEKPYKCEICKKPFTQKNNLNIHMFTHTGEKPYKCEICDKSFTQKSNLNIHMFTHTDEKPYKCEICDKSFTRKDFLNIHMLTHTGEKPHKCHICNKPFTRKDHLNFHMLTHTGEKPHKCHICSKLYAYRKDLKHHMKNHIKE